MSTAIKPAVRAIADNMLKDVTFAEDGSPVFAEDAYARNLPEGLTIEGRQQYQKHDNAFICASALAFGEASTDRMKDVKDLDHTTGSVAMGTDKLDLGFKRKAEVSDGKGGRMDKPGLISVKYRATAHLGSVKKTLSDRAAELLGS